MPYVYILPPHGKPPLRYLSAPMDSEAEARAAAKKTAKELGFTDEAALDQAVEVIPLRMDPQLFKDEILKNDSNNPIYLSPTTYKKFKEDNERARLKSSPQEEQKSSVSSLSSTTTSSKAFALNRERAIGVPKLGEAPRDVQSHIGSFASLAEKRALAESSRALRTSQEKNLQKDWLKKLLAHVWAREPLKAQTMIEQKPYYVTSEEARMTYLMALLVTSQDEEKILPNGRREPGPATAFLMQYPELRFKKGTVIDQDGRKYNDISPYQYTLCLKHTQLREMMERIHFSDPEQEAASQAAMTRHRQEFSARSNEEMNALNDKYERISGDLRAAYQFYIDNITPQPNNPYFRVWTTQQQIDYFTRVIGRLQFEMSEAYRQELFKNRDFNAQTNFGSPEARQALQEARFWDNQSIHPMRRSPEGGKLKLMSCEEGGLNALIANLSDDNNVKYDPILIRAGNRYVVYAPQVRELRINEPVRWEQLDVTDIINLLNQSEPQISINPQNLVNFNEPDQGHVLEYSAAHKNLYDEIMRHSGSVVGSGLSFDFAYGGRCGWGTRSGVARRPALGDAGGCLGGFTTLSATRDQEQATTLQIGQHLQGAASASASAATATSALPPPSSPGNKLGR